MAIQRKNISAVDFRKNFLTNSHAYGFNESKVKFLYKDIFRLVLKWNNDQFVDIYESGDNHKYGMIKSSHKDKSGKITLCYSDFFHSRLINKNFDPLILLTFENVKDHAYPWLIVETIVNHDQMFGRLGFSKKMCRHLDNLHSALSRRINFGRSKDIK